MIIQMMGEGGLSGQDKDANLNYDNQAGEIDFFNKRTESTASNSKWDAPPIVSIATGRSHVLALDTAGRVYSWGSNNRGQLGYEFLTVKGQKKKVEEVRKPQLIEGLMNKQICQIYAGEYHSFAIQKDGEIYAWGNNSNSHLLIQENENSTIIYNPKKVLIDDAFSKIQKPSENENDSDKNSFNENTKILMNSYQQNKIAVWTSQRVVYI